MRFLKHTLIIIPLISSLLFLGVIIPVSHAEITLDGTLGPSGSLPGPDYVISDDLGSLHGSNLFHSFGEFSVLTGESATFTGPDMIENVIGRVTGGNSSFIDGLLSCTILDANLFLLNPSGVMFGPNATLDVNGSFHVSTADFIRLSDNGVFYADPAQTSVLTIAPPSAFGFLGDNPAGISIEGSLLQVTEGKTISVVGGDIEIIGGTLRAGSGRINIASVASSGEVSQDMNIASFERLGEIDIAQDGELTVSGDTPGSIFIRGGNLTVDNSSIFSSAFGSLDGGCIDIHLSEDLVLVNGGGITASSNGAGDASEISVEAQNVSISGGGYIRTTAESFGDAGDISLTVAGLEIKEDSKVMSATTGSGDAGDVTVTATGSISISGSISGAYYTGLSSDTFLGTGNAGDIHVYATTLMMDGGVISSESVLGNGDAGGIHVEVGSLELTGGALITSNTSGDGVGGDVRVNATDSVSISGSFSGLQSSTSGNGNAGSISVTTPTMMIEDGGLIQAASFSAGNGGDIFIEIGSLKLMDGGQITTDAYFTSTGQGGSVSVAATDSIFISNKSSDPLMRSSISSATEGPGDAGTISISTPTLISDNGRIEAQTLGSGRAGDIIIEAGSLVLMNGAQITTSNFSETGQGGIVMVTATESISISGHSINDPNLWSGIFSETSGYRDGGTISISTPTLMIDEGLISASTYHAGRGGDLFLDVGSLTLTDGAQISSGSLGVGDGGDLSITAESVSISGFDVDSDGNIFPSGLFSRANEEGNAGGIFLAVGDLSLTGGAYIDSSSWGSGNGGTVTVTATNSISITGEESGLFSIAGGSGAGGDIELHANQVNLTDKATISAESTGAGNAGCITMNVSDTFMSRNSSVTTESKEADGGNIYMNLGYMLHLLDSEITASVGGGPETVGGNITIDPEYVVLNNSKIIANAYEGKGGNIQISAETFLADPGSVVSASSALGIHGTVDIRAPVINLSGILAPLPKGFLSAAELLREPCEARLKGGEYSSFVICGRDGLPIQPHGLLPSPIYLEGKCEEED